MGRVGLVDCVVVDSVVDSARGDGWAVDEDGEVGCVGEEVEAAGGR